MPSDTFFTPARQAALDHIAEVNERDQPLGTLFQAGLAAFETEHLGGAFLNWYNRPAKPEVVPGYTPFEGDEIFGTIYEPYASSFVGSGSPAETLLIKKQLDHELSNRQLLASRGWQGFFLQLGAGILSPENLIPVGVGINSVRAGGRIAQAAAGGLKAGFIGGATAEIGLQAFQRARGVDESLLNVGFGTLLGGVLGSGAGALAESAVTALKAIDDVTVGRLSKNIGAAQADITDEVLSKARERYISRHGFGGFDPGKFAKIVHEITPEANMPDLNFLSRNILRLSMSPTARMFTSTNPIVRTIARRIFKDPIPMKDATGVADVPLESSIDKILGDHYLLRSDLTEIHNQAVTKGETTLDPKAWREQLRVAASQGPEGLDPSVEKGFSRLREFMDDAEAFLVETGFLPRTVDARFANFYFPRLYDMHGLDANEEALREALIGSFHQRKKLDLETAEIRADRVIENMRNDVTGGLALGRRSEGTRFVAERAVPLTDSELLELGVLNTDIDQILENFTSRMLSRAVVAQAMTPTTSVTLKSLSSRMGKLAVELNEPHAARELLDIHRSVHYSKAGVVFAHHGDEALAARIEFLDAELARLRATEDAIAKETDPEKLTKLHEARDETLQKLDEHVKIARQVDSDSARMLDLDAKYKNARLEVREDVPPLTSRESAMADELVEINADLRESPRPEPNAGEIERIQQEIDSLRDVLRSLDTEEAAARGSVEHPIERLEDPDARSLGEALAERTPETRELLSSNEGLEEFLSDTLRMLEGEGEGISPAARSFIDSTEEGQHLIDDVMLVIDEVARSIPDELIDSVDGAIRRAYNKSIAKDNPKIRLSSDTSILREFREFGTSDHLAVLPLDMMRFGFALDEELAGLLTRVSDADRLEIAGNLGAVVDSIVPGKKYAKRFRELAGARRALDIRGIEVRRTETQRIIDDLLVRENELISQSDPPPSLSPDARAALEARREEIISEIGTLESVIERRLETRIVKREPTEAMIRNDPDLRARMFDALEDDVFVLQRANADAASSMRAYTNRAIKDFNTRIRALSGKTDKKSVKLREALKKEKADFIKDIEHVLQRMYRENGQPQDPASMAFRATGVIRGANFLRLGGGFAISSLPDIGMQIMRNGLGTFMKTFAAVMRNPSLLTLARDQRSLVAAELAGQRFANIADLNTAAFMTQHHDAFGKVEGAVDTLARGRTFGSNTRFGGALGSKVFQTARGEVPGLAKVTLLAHWNAFGSSFASLSAGHNLIDAAVRFSNGSKVAKSRMTKIRELGFTDGDLRAIAEQYKLYGGSSGRLKLSGADNWDHPVARKFRDAIRNDVRNTVLTVGVGNLPRLADGAIARVLFQFRSFAIAANQAVLVPALSRPDQAAITGILTAIMIGGFVEILNAANSDRRELNTDALLRNAVDRSGVMGIVTEVDNIAEKLTGWGVMNTLFQQAPATRYQQRNILDALFGASVGFITDTARVVHDSAQLGFDQGTLNTARRLAPYQNLVWLRRLVDTFQENFERQLPERSQ